MEEEVIDLSELLRLLWSHVLQIVAVGLVADTAGGGTETRPEL